MSFIKNVHVVLASLDLKLFQQSLSKATSVYWPARGRLEQDGEGWKIDCATETPVHLLVENAECLPSWDSKVVQDPGDISNFLPKSSSIFHRDRSLLHLKLTFCEEVTVIGVGWHHVLGDATTLYRFMLTLSEFYQNAVISSLQPSFWRHHFQNPSEDTYSLFSSMMPHLRDAVEPPVLAAKYGTLRTFPVHFFVPRQRAAALRDDIQARMSGSPTNLSLQDCLTAFIVAAINRCEPNAVQRITNAAQWRGISDSWASQNVAGNPIYIIPTQDIDTQHRTNIAHIALLIRQSIITAREPDFVNSYMATAGQLMHTAAETGKQFYFGSDPNTLSVNSTISVNWQRVNFGVPNAKFYTSGVSRYYLRLFRANTTNTDLIDVSLGVPEALYPRLMELLPLKDEILDI
ncbi:hypothetical protein VNI00_008391 [Paramarasmius palmivorus]|uniref:Uncharacterized protein n=1 Tax=Paramarasmius palmivorus TaxID=297713 RepID=A0AAW0CUY7_9AGAR